ncbi:MAG TPA: hypothetical protein VGS11_13670, partial [Candidatus Bathyarchaeia archaeon]|nr:hypothetical protein [Candidatus Bathyarchaeia archaeon]
MLIASSGAGYFVGTNISREVTTVSTMTYTTIVFRQTATFSSHVSPEGLQLQIRLNTTTLQQGGALTAQIVVMNTLNRNITLTPRYSSNSNISIWNMIDFLCGDAPYWGRGGLAGFALFHGHITPVNLSLAGNPLTLAPTVPISCAVFSRPTSVVILPFSDRVVAYSYSSGILPYPRQALINASTEYCVGVGGNGTTSCGHLTDSLFGYWDYSNSTSGP